MAWATQIGWPVGALRRFWNYVLIDPQGCWQWKGGIDHGGYACFYKDRIECAVRAHRMAWEIFYGPVPKGLHVLHRCDNRSCVNPGHLFLGTHDENYARHGGERSKSQRLSGKGSTPMTHPVLRNPKRAQAFAALQSKPTGSVREWADAWGWKKDAVCRFLKTLEREGLAVVVSKGIHGSRVIFPQNPRQDHDVPATRQRQDRDDILLLDSRLTGSRCGEAPEETRKQEPAAAALGDAERLIDALNTALVENNPAFERINLDNKYSHRTAARILARIPVNDAVRLVYAAGKAYNPSKSGGAFPYTLGHKYITGTVFGMWETERRDAAAEQLPLIPAISMRLERTIAPISPPESDGPKASPESIAAGMEEMKRLWASD